MHLYWHWESANLHVPGHLGPGRKAFLHSGFVELLVANSWANHPGFAWIFGSLWGGHYRLLLR
ncbi:hypothetical protein CJF30_00004700 [Rutstroemia sp. NJR-2017a BBW]|nr:hypothetical protein CJF30_00004700 [Rutstroemia sp. NJR-2017a BBW]